jgi:hypothetical protein
MSWLTPSRTLKLLAASAVAFLIWLTASDKDCVTAANSQPLEAGLAPAVLRGELCNAEGSCEPALLMAGAIEYGMTERILFDFADLMKYPDGRTAGWVCLLSAGGNVGVANEVARGFRYLGLNTCVVPISEPSILRLKGIPSKRSATECASACVILFLGGRERLLHKQASIAVHQDRINGGASCKAYYFRAGVEDLVAAVQRVLRGSPIALESKVFWYGAVTPSHQLHRIDAAALAGTNATYDSPRLRDATWRLIRESGIAEVR